VGGGDGAGRAGVRGGGRGERHAGRLAVGVVGVAGGGVMAERVVGVGHNSFIIGNGSAGTVDYLLDINGYFQ
jgi:hypothetical protein